MKRIPIAYFGTPDFSADLLKMILDDITLPVEVKLVITQPDKAAGRKKILTPTPVKKCAQEHDLDLYDLPDLSNLPSILREYEIDLALLFAYGKIIKKDLLGAPKYGFWNIHPSLLPKYRGTSPITYPLILADKTTGVTLMKMDSQMDHGPIIAQKKININPHDRNPDLQQKSVEVAFELLKGSIFSIDSLQISEQNHSQATYTRFQNKADGFISLSVLKKAMNGEELTDHEIPIIINEYISKNLESNPPVGEHNSALAIYNLFRGLYSWPGIWTLLPNKKRMKITDVELIDNKLNIKKVQVEGKTETDFKSTDIFL